MCILEFIGESSGLCAAVSVGDVALGKYAGDEDFAYDVPLEECGGTSHRHSDAVED